ncbi:TBC domain protein [Dictyocaulus viviparus]|uniref:TBC domain protein n=1 Tax=Dictyocaulus viviparus TaxID=29172 RepID=A0A0D8XLG1_DICVI|nr:TBC domain protein [Dictyocaulus viviparus]
MSRWSVGFAPGSVKPVYGARYPPLQHDVPCRSPNKDFDKQLKFHHYENSVSDAWDTRVFVDDALASASAARVLSAHAAAKTREEVIMPPVNPAPTKNGRIQALQRLATQKDSLPSSLNKAPVQNVNPIYPKLPEISGDQVRCAVNTTPSQGGERDRARFERLRRLFSVGKSIDGKSPIPDIDMDELRKDCWMGIPHKLRPHAWRLLSGYLPTNYERRETTLASKREQYWHYVEQYFHLRFDDQNSDTFRQIHIDIPRMCPLIPLFQQKLVQEIFERILYIWAIRHPGSGYVQGINDLVTPFFVVFLSEFIPQDVDVGSFDVSQLTRDQCDIVEADSFWCVSALLDSIHDNYTFAQPGIQRKVLQLKHLMSRVDRPLHDHFESNGIEYLQFSFRWMNNLLMREIPLRATIRLWDTYLSESDGFSQFHSYVCAAFLRTWSRKLQEKRDFQEIMILLQNLPTNHWGDWEIRELTADAYSLMFLFDGAKRHLSSPVSV